MPRCTIVYLAMAFLAATEGYAASNSADIASPPSVNGRSGKPTSHAAPSPASQGLQFIPLTPCRLVDTRSAAGPFGGPEMTAASTRTFNLPSGPCSVPSTALAYSLNVTVVPDAVLGYLSIWPAGQSQPLVSTLNSDGRVKANAAIVPAGSSGGVSVYVSNQTQVILDINGYFVPAGTASALSFYPLPPCRVADTRGPANALGGPFMAGGAGRSFPILSSACSVPSMAQAYSLNFTVVPHVPLGYLSTWPAGNSQPLVSTLNTSTTDVTANAAIVPAGASGAVFVYASNDTDLIVDINGYFAPPSATGLSLYTITPCRVLDTRQPGGGSSISGTLPVNFAASNCGVPSAAQAYVVNATVVPDTVLGYLSMWPDGVAQPLVSTLNASDEAVTSNMGIVPTSNGSIDAYASSGTHLILDASSYFAAPGVLPSSLPLAPLYLSSSGIDLTLPFTVQFTNASGYSVTENALRVSSNGSIVVAVPLYVDPATHQIGPGTVSVTVNQGTYTTPPLTVGIQDLPSVSSYGLQPGDATHAMLVFDALLLARRINQLQAFQNLPGNTVDTTAAQTTLQTLLTATIEARHDVDSVILDPTKVIQDETLPNGLVVQFDSNALDMMDRVNANFISQTFGNVTIPTGSAIRNGAERPKESGGSTLKAALSFMQTVNGAKEYTEGNETLQQAQNWVDRGQAAAQAAGGAVDVLVGTGVLNETAETTSFGLVAAVVHDTRTIADAFAQDAAFAVGWATGNKALQDVAVEAMTAAQSENTGALKDLVLLLLDGTPAGQALGNVSTVADFLKTASEVFGPEETQADQAPIDLANEAQAMPAESQNFGYVDGIVNVANSGGISAAQTGIDLSSTGIELDTLADPGGNYQVVVPLGNSTIDYSNANLEAYDPIADSLLNSETVDLSGLTFANPFQAPTLTGSCSDTDDDEDDPDCDLRKATGKAKAVLVKANKARQAQQQTLRLPDK